MCILRALVLALYGNISLVGVCGGGGCGGGGGGGGVGVGLWGVKMPIINFVAKKLHNSGIARSMSWLSADALAPFIAIIIYCGFLRD